jgi:hypothetical protein
MTDDLVLARAANALRLWDSFPLGTIQRVMQRAVFDSAMAELDRRLVMHVRASIEGRG